MRYLGIDYGDARVGLSISDNSATIASPLKVINNKDETYLFNELNDVLKEYNIDAFVLGLPINMNGTEGTRVEKTNLFKEALEKRYNKEVIYQDERLSTVEAQNILLSNDTRRKDRKKVVDKIASTIILQTYLDKKGK